MHYAKIHADYFSGIDLHARTMFVCIMNKMGKILFQRNLKNDFKLLAQALEPYRDSIAVGVESTFNWYWLADGCHNANIPFFLGHALDMKAIHGGKKKNDRLDAQTLADLMRTNFFPLAYPYPQEMRATRDLLRRRHRFVALRAEGYTHIQNTFSQQAILDPLSLEVKNRTTRRELCQRFSDPDLDMTIHCDLDLIDTLDVTINKVEKQIEAQAKHHDRNAYALLRTTPGIGKMLALTILYETHTITRFHSASNFSPACACLPCLWQTGTGRADRSYCRLVKVEKTSAGKRTGQENNKIGNPHPCLWQTGQMGLLGNHPARPGLFATHPRLLREAQMQARACKG